MNEPTSDSSEDTGVPSGGERVIEGAGASPGVAIGAVHLHVTSPPAVERDRVAPDEVDDELALLDEALARARDDLARVRSVAKDTLGADGEAIFEAQALMLDDDELLRAVRSRIQEEHASAARAIASVLEAHRERLADSDDPYLRERAHDLDELEARLLRTLRRGAATPSIQSGSIVVADRLTAADVIRFNQHGMRGCATARGGPTSHVAIIARALQLPAVVGVDGATDAVEGRDRAIVDGDRGRIVVRPTPDTVRRYKRAWGRASRKGAQGKGRGRRLATADGHRVTLQANIEFDEALDQLDESGAAGIGLLRTEMLLLSDREGPLDEQEQVRVYRRAAAAAGDHGATIRLLDLGGDKLLPVAEQENNPFLGWRGVRVLLDRPDELLRPQIRALLRANAHGPIRVLLPMVTHLDEVRRVRAVVTEEAERLSAHGTEHDADLPMGVMVEVPAVALQAHVFSEHVDFLSIGTNDLTQFVLAIDRGNERVADRFDALHPAVLDLVRRTVEAAQATDTPVALCGEVAGDAEALPILLGLGLHTLSLAPPTLPSARRLIRQIERAAAEELAAAACADPDAATVRQRARGWLREHVGDGALRPPPPPSADEE
jgi:phosphotransferase system enzyme I (PtsI)